MKEPVVKKILGLVLLPLVLAGCGSTNQVAAPTPAAKPATTTIDKDVYTKIDVSDLIDQMFAGVELVSLQSSCKADLGVVKAGDQVVIRAADGATTLAVGSLGVGVYGQDGGGLDPMKDVPCIFSFSIEEVPLGEKFYEIQIGEAPPITMAQDDLTSPRRIDIG